MLQVIGLFDPSALVLLSAEWRALHDRSALATPFQSWEWLSAWWRWKGRGTPLILCARQGGALVGLLPLVVDNYRGLPLRRVTFMGTPLSDYQDLIAEPGREAECRDAFLQHLAQHRDRWDMLDLTDVRQGSALAAAELPASEFWLLRAHHRVCAYIALPESYGQYSRTLGEGLRFECAGEDDLPAVLDEMFELHTQSWRRRGQPGAFGDPDVRRFHHDAARQLCERGWLRLHRIADGNGATRAALYGMAHRGWAYSYVGGSDLSLAVDGPGDSLEAHAIERALADGARGYHVLRREQQYPLIGRAEQRHTLRLVMGQHTLRSSLAAEVSRVEQGLAHLRTRLRRRLSRHAA